MKLTLVSCGSTTICFSKLAMPCEEMINLMGTCEEFMYSLSLL
jgi:hypothetical protein